MPLGAPQGPTSSQWTIDARSVTTIGEYPVQLAITATTDNPNAPEMGAIVQQFVDLIARSEHFRLSGASRTYSYSEAVTPTV
ncbi:hypothetical protein [Streptomyces flavidovirens]|uniref:hypothetical protein n=1 Tax=Streptomyces flavidovirens TaxID=67298 RepID=UPI00048B5EE7|nr:hypothetical protein [Streptomyces flavidovirens]